MLLSALFRNAPKRGLPHACHVLCSPVLGHLRASRRWRCVSSIPSARGTAPATPGASTTRASTTKSSTTRATTTRTRTWRGADGRRSGFAFAARAAPEALGAEHERLEEEAQLAVFDVVAIAVAQRRGDVIASHSSSKGRRPEPRKGREAEGRPLRGEDDGPRPGGRAAGLPGSFPGSRAGATTRRAWSEERSDDRSEHRSCTHATLRRQCQRLKKPRPMAAVTAWCDTCHADEKVEHRGEDAGGDVRRRPLATRRDRPW